VEIMEANLLFLFGLSCENCRWSFIQKTAEYPSSLRTGVGHLKKQCVLAWDYFHYLLREESRSTKHIPLYKELQVYVSILCPL
jgi:hypothetical protein